MTRENLESIKKFMATERRTAERILNGDTEYDGADGARSVCDLCRDMDELIAVAELHCEELPPVAGRESP